jgi:hypothetical protein
MKGTTSFNVPDSFNTTGDFVMDRVHAKPNSSVKAQAELLRGIARQLRFHRDWEKNDFDEQMSTVQLEDLASEIPKGAIEYSLFPKDLIFALSLGNAGAILQNVIRKSSPAFLVMTNKPVLWGERYEEIGTDNLATVAGLVSIENGKRGKSVRTADIARYVLALSEFMDATEGMEKTKASPLTALNSDGKPMLNDVLEARRYMKLFQMGLTNFLVFATCGRTDTACVKGSVHGQYSIENGKLVPVKSPITLENQALVIRAIIASARTLGMSVFNPTALDAYFFMNEKLWDEKRQFYAVDLNEQGETGRAPNIVELAQALVAGSELAPLMGTESRHQWEKISMPWIHALQDL